MSARGSILNWDHTADLPSIKVPALMIGARHDPMDPKHMAFYKVDVDAREAAR